MFTRTTGTLMLMLAAILLVAAACGGEDEQAGGAPATQETEGEETTAPTDTTGSEIDAPFGFDVDPVGNSDTSGQVTITPTGEQETDVEVLLDAAGAEAPHPVHIHEGTCDDLNPEPAFPLEDVEGGTSSTTIDVGATELLEGEYAVNVHESADQLDTYIACGEIPSRDDVIQGS